MHSFFQFVQKVHDLSDCKKSDDEDIEIFVGCKSVLFNPDNSYDEQKAFFISYCINFAGIYVKCEKKPRRLRVNYIQRFKFLREENKSLSNKLSQKEGSKDLEQQREHLENQLGKLLGEIEVEKARRDDKIAGEVNFEENTFFCFENLTYFA